MKKKNRSSKVSKTSKSVTSNISPSLTNKMCDVKIELVDIGNLVSDGTAVVQSIHVEDTTDSDNSLSVANRPVSSFLVVNKPGNSSTDVNKPVQSIHVDDTTDSDNSFTDANRPVSSFLVVNKPVNSSTVAKNSFNSSTVAENPVNSSTDVKNFVNSFTVSNNPVNSSTVANSPVNSFSVNTNPVNSDKSSRNDTVIQNKARIVNSNVGNVSNVADLNVVKVVYGLEENVSCQNVLSQNAVQLMDTSTMDGETRFE